MPVLRKNRGLLLIISGPAGSGKTTLCDRLVQAHAPGLSRVVTSTTRGSRGGEIAGVDYHFLTDEEFEAKIDEDAFYEHALVHGKRYGVLKSEVLGKLEAGVDLVLCVDVQGAATLRRVAEKEISLRDSLASLMLMPPDIEVIRQRLEGRGTDNPEEIKHRLRVASDEISHWREYDYCIVSSDRDEDFAQVEAIYKAERSRVSRLVES